MNQALGPLDVVKGAGIFVRFKMKYRDGSVAPSEVYSGWVTRVTAADVVWVKFGKNGNTLVFDLHRMVDNERNYYKANEQGGEERKCVDTLLQMQTMIREPMMFRMEL